MPETSDSDFSWRHYVRANNDELVATYGNLVHRVLTMSHRNFDEAVPKPGDLDAQSVDLLDEAAARFQAAGEQIEARKFRSALGESMALARSANRYVESKEPWKTLKSDSEAAATTLWTSLAVVNCLKTALYPFLPFSSERLHTILGFRDTLHDGGWTWNRDALEAGQHLGKPEPLFAKLDEAIIEQETERIGR